MMQIRFSFALVFVFDKRYVLKYVDQSRLRFVVKNICIPAYSFVLVLRCRLTIMTETKSPCLTSFRSHVSGALVLTECSRNSETHVRYVSLRHG